MAASDEKRLATCSKQLVKVITFSGSSTNKCGFVPLSKSGAELLPKSSASATSGMARSWMCSNLPFDEGQGIPLGTPDGALLDRLAMVHILDSMNGCRAIVSTKAKNGGNPQKYLLNRRCNGSQSVGPSGDAPTLLRSA